MSTEMKPTSPSEGSSSLDFEAGELDAVGFPTETEIYLLPNGEVIIADMPAELENFLAKIGVRTGNLSCS